MILLNQNRDFRWQLQEKGSYPVPTEIAQLLSIFNLTSVMYEKIDLMLILLRGDVQIHRLQLLCPSPSYVYLCNKGRSPFLILNHLDNSQWLRILKSPFQNHTKFSSHRHKLTPPSISNFCFIKKKLTWVPNKKIDLHKLTLGSP